MASFVAGYASCAPGNTLSLPCDGFTAGAGSMLFSAQGGYGTLSVTVDGAIATNPAAVYGQPGSQVFTFPVPDGLVSGIGLLADTNGTTASIALRVESQYVQADEYVVSGEGMPIVLGQLAPGELDAILRRASAYADTFMGEGVRYLQKVERHKYRAPRNDSPPRLFPFRLQGRANRCPIVSVDSLKFISASDLITSFNLNDIYANRSTGYIEILAYAVGNYALLGALEVIGYSANVFELEYTSGYTVATYPSEIREAVTMMATSLLSRRMLQSAALSGVASRGAWKLDPKNPESGAAFQMPIEAKRMLSSYCCFSVQ